MGPDSGDVGHPGLVRAARREVPVEPIRGDRVVVLRVGRRAEALPSPSYKAIVLYELCDLFRADKVAAMPKLSAHARAAVTSLMLDKHGSCLRREPRVAELALGLGLGEVIVEATALDAQDAAEDNDREGHPLRGDERVPHAFALAQKVAAAFRISGSCLSVFTSRRRRPSSCRSSVVSMSCRSPAPASARRTHSPADLSHSRWQRGRLQQRLHEHFHGVLRFVVRRDVPADNNATERDIRFLATYWKVTGGTRSELGSITTWSLDECYPDAS